MSSKPFAITLDVGTSLANRTGSWRTLRPVYVNRLPPCNAKCPAGEQCQAWLYHAESGDYRHAWEKIVEDNPFPACMGRVCYHTCESACNRGELDESVGINAVERFLGDHALENGWSFKKPETKSGKRVLVVGAGPAGLSAAYHLARMGHEVCVRDGAKAAGGMMRYGIPKYRLPREVLDKEIARIAELGVKFELSREVTDLAAVFARSPLKMPWAGQAVVGGTVSGGRGVYWTNMPIIAGAGNIFTNAARFIMLNGTSVYLNNYQRTNAYSVRCIRHTPLDKESAEMR